MKKIKSCSFCHTADVTIRNYISLTFLMLCVSGIQAQIIYTDITDTILTFPEETPGVLDDSTNYFFFDLDADGDNDFYFYAHYWEEWMSPSAPEYPQYVMQLNSMVMIDAIPWSDGCAVDFAYADTIRNDEWESWGLLRIDILAFSDNCNLPFQDRYIGLRLIDGANYYYGWIRLDANSDTLTFKDLAINTVANQEIFAGQTSSISTGGSPAVENIDIHYDGKRIHFKSGTFTSYAIYNTQGKLVEKGRANEGDCIDLNNFQSGMYVVEVSVEGRKIRRKMVVQ